jgi:tRNA dimethylallyltransferase
MPVVIDLHGVKPASSLVVLVGPTAVGKTIAAVELARDYDVEVISADSRQVYRGMDIGTAKPSPREQGTVRHHLVDVVDPDQPFSLADYLMSARAAIADVQERGKLPLLVGGTGLYVRAVTEGMSVPAVPPNLPLRAELAARVAEHGTKWLREQIQAIDPVLAERECANPRRMIRALEVYEATGKSLSSQQVRTPPDYRVLWFGLTMPRADLYARADRRVDAMLRDGLVAEVQRLAASGCSWDLPSMSGLGYRQIGEYLRGECDLATAIVRIKHATHAFIRHQYNWFRLSDPRITWLLARSDAVEHASAGRTASSGNSPTNAV